MKYFLGLLLLGLVALQAVIGGEQGSRFVHIEAITICESWLKEHFGYEYQRCSEHTVLNTNNSSLYRETHLRIEELEDFDCLGPKTAHSTRFYYPVDRHYQITNKLYVCLLRMAGSWAALRPNRTPSLFRFHCNALEMDHTFVGGRCTCRYYFE